MEASSGWFCGSIFHQRPNSMASGADSSFLDLQWTRTRSDCFMMEYSGLEIGICEAFWPDLGKHGQFCFDSELCNY